MNCHCPSGFIFNLLLVGTALFALPVRGAGSAEAPLALAKGNHLSIIGNELAELMQHNGSWETLLHSRFPELQLTVRNLGFAGDEVKIRQRTAGFGSPDEHLRSNKTDVVLAFFGFNESFGGTNRINGFKSELEEFVKRALAQKYNGQGAPKVILFSPIAQEDLDDPNLADGTKNNKNLALYTQAMREVADETKIVFVDLFEPSQKWYRSSKAPLTSNGVHLNDEGYRYLALHLDKELFGNRPSTPGWKSLEPLRHAVLDKDFYWFHRYQTTDGYNVYGGRSTLKFVDDITNRDSLQREMVVLDVMAANRDQHIWAVAQGSSRTVDDDNTPPFIDVKSNKPGPGPKGEHIYLGGEEAIGKMKLAEGLQITLVASEEKFPELGNPVQMAFDTKGRLWVATWPGYPHWKPKTKMNDRLLILEDKDGDGKTDKVISFADNLHDPTGFEFYNGGVLVAEAPYLLFLKDTDGDDKADVRVRLLSNLSSGDTHHTANSFTFDPGGALYFQEGTFHQTQIETPYGPRRNNNACVWRFEPLTWKVDRYVPYGFANPHGHVFDRWGQDFVTDGTGAETFHATLFSGHIDFPKTHAKPPLLYKQRERPCPATEILSSSHFPEANRGNFLVANVIGFLGILQYQLKQEGSSFVGKEVEPILRSTDQNFRPADLEIGPDGALYLLDWQNAIIGHMQHHLRDPSRDHEHGRVYRITHKDSALLKPQKIAGQPIARLLALLKDPDDRVRYRAKIELSSRKPKEVVSGVKKWVGGLDEKDSGYEHHLMEALWVHQWHNVVNEELLKKLLRAQDPNARAAATRVLCYWRDQLTEPLELLKVQVEDESPLVRLEGVRACSFFPTAKAAEVALLALNHPMNNHLKFCLDETMKQMDQFLK